MCHTSWALKNTPNPSSETRRSQSNAASDYGVPRRLKTRRYRIRQYTRHMSASFSYAIEQCGRQVTRFLAFAGIKRPEITHAKAIIAEQIKHLKTSLQTHNGSLRAVVPRSYWPYTAVRTIPKQGGLNGLILTCSAAMARSLQTR